MNADQSKHMTEKARSGLRACWGKAIDANNTVSGYVEKGLSHTGVKGSWIPAASRWLMPACIGIVLVGVATSGDPQSSFAAPNLPGRTIGVQVHTVTSEDYRPSAGWEDATVLMNSGLGNLTVRTEATSGMLYLRFDYDPEKWVIQYNAGRGNCPIPLLIRLFDANGQHVTHFTTAERLLPSSLAERWEGADMTLLKPVGNELVYQVNLRDLAFAERAEVGFAKDKPYGFHLEEEVAYRAKPWQPPEYKHKDSSYIFNAGKAAEAAEKKAAAIAASQDYAKGSD